MSDEAGDTPNRTDTVDLDLLRQDADEPIEDRRRTMAWPIAIVAVLIAAAGGWYVYSRLPGAPPASTDTPKASASVDQPAGPLGGTPATIDVPPLDASDALVRELVRQVTAHPAVATWLATDGLIRNFTVVVTNVADGATPARQLRVLRPSRSFAVVRRGNDVAIDPDSYHRFDVVAAAAASVDATRAAQIYATLKPRIEEAYRDLGHPDTPVDRAVEQAIVRLLQTPVVDRPLRVEPGTKGIGYVYADANLESLTAAQKQLLRMGPDNMRTIQRAIRDFALALGIPQSRLPAPATAR
jgi:hypothetical protein